SAAWWRRRRTGAPLLRLNLEGKTMARLTAVRAAAAAGLLLAWCAAAAAQPLNPNNFTAIAASFAPTGNVTINTDTLQITGSGFTTVTGVTAAQANGGP